MDPYSCLKSGFLMRSSSSSCRLLVIMLCCISLGLLELSLAAEFEYKWSVEYMIKSPDCVEGLVMGINGQSPGPTIKVTEGDTVVVHLTNKLETEGVVIHWHGIRQIGTPWDDGTAAISQCAIIPHQTYIYKFKADKAGTYFYHGHYGMQRSAGLYGSLIVEAPILDNGKRDEPFEYDEELPMLLLSDWWHKDVHSQGARLSANPMLWIGEPQSILINGRGHYDCSRSPHLNTCTLDCENSRSSLEVKPNKRYKLRIASTTSLASLDFAIANHEMTLVEADGNYIEPLTRNSIPIYSGDSYSVIFTTNQDSQKDYWISATVIGRKGTLPPPGAMVLSYEGKDPIFVPRPVVRKWNDNVDFERLKKFTNQIHAHRITSEKHQVPSHDHRMVLTGAQKDINGHKKWLINETPLTLPAFPLLGILKPNNENKYIGKGIYMVKQNTVVDVILQNDLRDIVKDGAVSEIHPWHLHGHEFWVLGYGEGTFTEAQDGEKLNHMKNIINPPLRNTVAVYPGGWTAIRFVADNPGVWAFHCHIEPHLHMGMGVIFALGLDQLKEKVPEKALMCMSGH